MAANFPVKNMTLFILWLFGLISRVVSNLKFYAMNPVKQRVICHWSTEIKYPYNITYGKGVIIGPKCTLGARSKISIGSNVRISKGVIINEKSKSYFKIKNILSKFL